MFRARIACIATLTAALAAAPALAQTLSEREARRAVPSANAASVVVADVDFLGRQESRAVEQYASQFTWYAAMAVSPGDPAESGSAVALQNYHSPADAQRAALSACNDRRTSGGPCVIVATVVPRDYEQGVPTLSKEAVAALRGEFRRMDAPKALAVSPATGQFAFARGDGARALSSCNARAAEAGAQDCRIAVFER